MNRKLRRVIALILCVTLIVGIDNYEGFSSIFKYINNKITTMGATQDKATDIMEESSEETSETEQDVTEVTSETDETDEEVTASEHVTVNSDITRPYKNTENTTVTEETTASAEPETTHEERETVNQNVINKPMALAASDGIQLTEATELVAGGIYLIRSYADWTKLSQVSQTSTLEGMTFIVYKRDSRYDDWTLSNLKIGCREYPFSGTLYSYYSTTTIYTNTILFDYLSSKAHIGVKESNGIKTFVLSYTANVPAGLANNLILDKAGCEVNIGENGVSNYYVKIIKGSIVSNAAAGGLFANVYVEDNSVSPEGSTESIYKINISGTGIDLSGLTKTITGKFTGGLIGYIYGDIDVNITSLPGQLTTTVANNKTTIKGTGTDSAAGSLMGKVSSGVDIVFNNSSKIILSANITGAYYSGGLIGYMENSDIECTKGIVRSGNTEGLRYVGGLLGYVKNSTCTIADYTQNNNTHIYQYDTGTSTYNMSVGGLIGMYANDSADSADVVDISYIKTQNKDAGVYSVIKVTSINSGYNKVGGIIGIINSGNAKVHIHHINTDTESKGENSYNANMIYHSNGGNSSVYNETGGIAGVVAGNNIIIEDIIFNYVYNSGDSGCYSNSLSGGTVGDIAARVGYYNNVTIPSKVIIKNVKVLKSYVRRGYNYQGGLFGVVSKSAIALQGDIDLSGVPYITHANSERASVGYVLLATLRNRGFVAGYASESLIYLDTDANYTRPITYDETGNIQQFDANVVSHTNKDTANTNSTYMYCIDDIGNYGSLFRNVENVLDITQDMNNIVTGKVDKDAGGNYVIDTLGDALRLAVAGQTVKEDGYPRFGGNCFVNEGETAPKLSDILAGHYVIKTDLNLGNAGIHGFVENDNVNKYPFTGTFEGEKNGEGKNPVITMDFISRQKYGGLFPSANNATFKNLDIAGNIFFLGGVDYNNVTNYNVRAGAGSLAAYATGNITVDNVNIYTKIKDSLNSFTQWDDGNMYCYGGMFGYYYPAGGSYSCTNSIIAPEFTSVRSNAHNGGMIGWVRINNSSVLTDMTISDCTVSVKITSNSAYTYGCGASNTHGRDAGLISMISDSFYNVSTTNNNNYAPVAVSDETNGTLNIKNIKIDGASIDLTASQATNNDIKISGGFLGYAWTNVDVNINKLSIENSVFNSRGCVGGLISYAAGKYNLTDIEIKSLAMKHVQPQYYNTHTYCGFLIGNGQNAFVTLNGYKVAKDGSVTYENYSNFDEIVGLNYRVVDGNNNEYIQKPNLYVSNKYFNGGIVNIIDDDFKSFTNGTYKSYVNQVVTDTNKYTRYYYNLFTEGADWTIPVSEGTGTVSTPEQWLTFHVACYTTSNLARYFKPYLSNTAISSISKISITSDLDMNGYSLYPTPLFTNRTIDGESHKITLYGENISDLETGFKNSGVHAIDRNNEVKTTQHYMMHASLFYEVSGTQTIQNLTLTGTAANIGTESGALMAGGITGKISIKDIKISDLRISHYNDTRCGLLVAYIGTNGFRYDNAADVYFDNITTVYSSSDNLPAAAALIGYVGSNDATDVKVTFKNMKVEDERTADKSQGKVFKYASYVYDYEYTQDLDKNRCYMLYTFTKADCDSGNVTFGEEIREGVQYYDTDRDEADSTDKLNIAIQSAKNGEYIPYVFTERNIYVNPRNGNITEGCGTYEDPYIITTPKQFLTLYLYLTGKEEYETMFKGTGSTGDADGVWKVVPIGGDGVGAECSKGAGGGTHVTANYGTDNFPSRDDLRTAYYKITADIVLSKEGDMNDRYIAGEFCGLGSSSYPFAGVIIGKGTDGNNHTITLPKQGTKRIIENGSIVNVQIEQSTFGLIQYMSGAVIKDINIVGEDYNNNAYYNITDCGGGVAAKILGGDNIIDNVKVSLNINTDNKHLASDGTGGINGLGGYVGVIQDGSLILRNIQDKKVVDACKFGNFTLGTVSNYSVYMNYVTKINNIFHATANDGISGQSNDTYTGNYDELAGMLVGRVYDGYVIYEGYNADGGNEPKVLRRNELKVSDKYTTEYPLVNGFHIINGNVLDSATESGRLTFTKTDNNTYKAVIKNGDQLEILALALNSDAFSVLYCESNDHDTGYGYKVKCRRALYSDVGETGALTGSDIQIARTYDDNKKSDVGYLYPYICYKYMDYTSLSTAGTTSLTDTAFAANNYEGYKTTLSKITRTETINASTKEVTNIVSNVNKTIPEVANYNTYYELEEKSDDADKLFDVSGYDMSFRGIGAIYTKTYSDFRANFNGNNNFVKFRIDRSYDDKIMYSGMFNELIYNQKVISENTSDRQLEIKNFTIKNSIVYNPNKFSIFENSSSAQYYVYNQQKGTTTCATGGVAGQVKGAWRFENITLTRDEAIADDKITADISGYKCVGGLVGRISNTLASGGYNTEADMNKYYPKSNDVDFINCDVKGTDDKYVKVTELGSSIGVMWAGFRLSNAGGLVGGIGTNMITGYCVMQLFGDVDFAGCDIDRLTITAMNKGNLGGFVGMVGVRWNSNAYNDSGWSAIGKVTVDGIYQEMEDENHNKYYVLTDSNDISNMDIVSNNATDDYSAGGIFGRVEAPKNYKGGLIGIKDCNIKNIKVDSNRTEDRSSGSAYEGTGGVIGYVRANLIDLDNIHLSDNNEIGNVYLRKYAGGLIGSVRPTGNNGTNYYQYRQANTLNIDNCIVNNTNVNTKDYSCGGFVGLAHIQYTNIGAEATGTTAATSNTVHDCNITSQSNGYAGGMIGYNYGDNMIANSNIAILGYTTNIVNASVYDTKIKGGDNAGGVIGASIPAQNVKSYLNFKNVVVYATADGKTLVQSSGTDKGYAGGLLGSGTNYWLTLDLQGYIGVGVKRDISNNTWVDNGETGVNIRGKYAGGVIGYQSTGYSESYKADIYVANNRIYSYVNTNDNNAPKTYSGGLFGYRSCYTGLAYRFNTVTVKNNVIFTGADNRTRNRDWGGVGCGGLYGYLDTQKNATTYMPYVTLENNSIGYYDADASAKQNNWNTVTSGSKDVKLYDATTNPLKSISWDSIDNLSDSNIGNYAVAFGQFIGVHAAADQTSQIFILRPEVKTDKTVGSIPVVDVGNDKWTATADQSKVTYGEGYPYLYRKNCHIVYMDNPTNDFIDISTVSAGRKPNYIESNLLIDNKKEYSFGNFESMISDYQNLNSGVIDVADKNYNFITAKRLNMYMPYNDDVTKYSLCTGDNSYYNLTYNLLNDDNTEANILNGVPVLILDGLDPQSVGDYAAAILTNGGGVVSGNVVSTLKKNNNTTMNNFWKITCQNAYIDTDGTIKPVDTNDSLFSEHKISSIQVSESNRLKLATSLYDEILQREGDSGSIYTITLLCYTYTCPSAVTTTSGAYVPRTETIYIPVYVKEKVTMNSYVRILSNEEYSFNEASHNGYKDEVHISHDSTYTIFAEFVYDAIRLKDSFKNDRVNKSITFDATVPVITVGTKFTLIDYASGKSYYYTADESDTDNVIPFSDFTVDGKEKNDDPSKPNYDPLNPNYYIQPNISDGIPDSMCKDTYTSIGYQEDNHQIAGTERYEKVGIERFFIVVEPPEEENNSVFYLNVKADAVDINGKAVDEFFNKNPYGDKEGIQVTYIPGPTIGFGGINDDTGYGTEGVTYIKGKISNETSVQLDANLEVLLKDTLSPYWNEKVSGNTIDSSNSGKYLEVAVTLLDENNEIVAWPSGTNISFNGGPKQVLENNLIIYMYKDIKREFPMDTIDNNLTDDCYYYNITEDVDNEDFRWLHKDDDGNYFYYVFNPTEGKWYNEYPNITGIKEEYLSITNQCNVTLDFSVADVEDYSGKNYTVMMKLYRSDSPEYPNEGTTKSYGDGTKRQYSGIITGESKRELAAAISADDLMDLGINLYTRDKNIYDIPFTNKLDFSGLIYKSKVDSDIAECAGKKYMVTYRLYKKAAAGGGTDRPDYGVGYNENIADIISRSDEYQYEIMDWNDAPFKLYDAGDTINPLSSTSITVNGNQTQSVIVTTREFTEDEIRNGTSGTQYVTEWGMNLEADTENMGNVDLTNYMITATYVPYDSDDSKPATDEEQTLFDYFIFTIAKLKTDL